MMRYVKPLTTVYINGVPRSPSEGVQRVTDATAEHFLKEGLAEDVTEEVLAGDPSPEPAAGGLDGLKVDELKALAESESINLGEASKKAEIIAAIRAARAAAASAPPAH